MALLYHNLRRSAKCPPVKTIGINFRLKASPGRGKLSPQVTDEGAGEQQFCGELPLIRFTSFSTFPHGGRLFSISSLYTIQFVY